MPDKATGVFFTRAHNRFQSSRKNERMEKIKKRVCKSKNPHPVSEARKKEEKEILAETRYTHPIIAAQVLLAQSLLGAASASGARWWQH